MRAFTPAIALVSIVSLACREAQIPVAPQGPIESPDYAVYDAVLEGLFQTDGATVALPRYVISDSTMLGDNVADASSHPYLQRQFGPVLAPLFDATIAQYTVRSRVQVPLDVRAFHARGQIELLSRPILNSLTTTGSPNPSSFWQAFYVRYPGSKGLISFSRPGYDASGTHALLSYGHGCGGLCGDWGFVLLERRAGRWVVLRRVITMVS